MVQGALVAFVDHIREYPGPFTFGVDGNGALLWLQYDDGDYAEGAAEILMSGGYQLEADPGRTSQARAELTEYCRGERTVFTITCSVAGTSWQQAVWRAVRAIPFGETRTYGEIAAGLGRPAAARAMGRANATNPVPIVIPCHRVLGANGSLTGFAGGLHIKRRLLEHETQVLAAR